MLLDVLTVILVKNECVFIMGFVIQIWSFLKIMNYINHLVNEAYFCTTIPLHGLNNSKPLVHEREI